MLTRLARITRDRDDTGANLIEMLVATTLATLIGGLALVWFIGGSRANSQTVDLNISTAGARNALQQWSSYLGVAAAGNSNGVAVSGITAITATSLTLAANLITQPTCTSGRCPSNAATTVLLQAAPATTRGGTSTQKLVQTVGTGTDTLVPVGVTLPAATNGCQLFTPYDVNNSLISCTALANGTVGYGTVARVDISFTLTGTRGAGGSFTTSASVGGGSR